MECWYRIEIEGKKDPIRFVPESLKDTSKELFFFDNYAITHGDEQSFYEYVKEVANIKGDIKKITIDYKRNSTNVDHNRYNLVFDNPYINEVLSNKDGYYEYIHKGNVKLLGTPVKEKNVPVVDTNSVVYNNMKNFVLKFLKTDSEKLLNIYHRKNTYSNIMNQYAILYQDKVNERISSEEYETLQLLETDVCAQLSRYGTFRAMAIGRYDYEKTQERIQERENIKLTKNLEKEGAFKPVFNDKQIDEYNQEYDEFLDEDEFGSMTGEGNALHIGK